MATTPVPIGYVEVPPPLPKGYKEVPAPAQPPTNLSGWEIQHTPTPQSSQPTHPFPALEPEPPPDKPWPEWFEHGLETAYKWGIHPFQKMAEVSGQQLKEAAQLPGEVFTGLQHTPEEVSNLTRNLYGQPTQAPEPLKEKSYKEHPYFQGFMGGAGELVGGAVGDPRNWPFFASGMARPLLQRLISGGFGVMMTKDSIDTGKQLIDNWDNLTPEQRTEELTKLGGGSVMATLSLLHAVAGNDKVKTLTPDEQKFIIQTVQDHYSKAIEEQKNAESEFQQVPSRATQPEGIPPSGTEHNAGDQTLPSSNAQVSGTEAIRNDTGVTGGEGAAIPDSLERAEQERYAREAAERESGGESVTDMDARLRGGLAPTTEESVAQLQSLMPEFNKVIGGGEGERAQPSVETATGAGEEPPPPVSGSEAVDNDNAAYGINVVRRGRDINVLSRFLGSFNETARKLAAEGHPLGPVLKSMAGIISDVTKNIAVNQTDTLKAFINGAQKLVSRDEWSNQVVQLMDRRVDERPANVPDNVWNAYQVGRNLDEQLRIKILTAKRQELVLNGFSPEKVMEWYPDTWGRQGEHYPHLHPGTWTITRLAEVDERGNETYEPISHPDISWRAMSEMDAKKAAQAYLQSNPNEQLRVRQDTVSLPGSGITDRARLRDLTDKIRDATTTIVRGGADPKEVLDQLYDQSGAMAYGPRNPAKRQFGPALKRETNLEGWSRDIEDFKDYLLAGERYTQLAPARQMLMKARNQIASLAGMPQVLKVGEFPATSKYFSAAQYGNILGRVDSAIEGLEGHPGAWDAGARYIANGMGLDPDIVAKSFRPVQQIVALMKLGFQPARILSHGLQTGWAVYPILGEEHTLKGIANSFNPRYDNLIHDLAVTHSGNMSDLEGLREYAGAYFGHGSTPLYWTKGTVHIIRDLGLMPFTMGIDFTRRVAAVGGYLQGLERGLPEAEARAYARDVMDRTTGMYNAADNATLLRQLPGPVSQFKGFMLKTLQFMTNLRGAEIPRFIAFATVMGAVGLPALRAISNLTEQATGYNPENELKRHFPVASRGVFGALGVDQPASVGFADWFASRPGIPLAGAAGPAGSDILNFAKAGIERFRGPSREAEQDLDQAVRQLSPEGRRIWDEAIRGTRLPNPGLIDPRTGASILHQLTPLERVEAVIGFTPLRVAEERESHEYIRNQLAQSKDQRGFFVDKLAENQLELMRPGLTNSQKADLTKETYDLQKLAAEYNQAHNLVPAVRDRIKGMLQERLERDLRKAPKPVRPTIYNEIQRFHSENP